MARPLELNSALIDQICTAVRNGTTRKHAARAAGVHVATFCRWMKFGREFDTRPDVASIYREFYERVRSAESLCITDCLGTIKRAAKPRRVRVVKRVEDWKGNVKTETTEKVEVDWAAASWLAERLDRLTYGTESAELRLLKKEMGELKQLVASTVGVG